MNNSDLARFEAAWEEAVTEQDKRGWGRFRRFWRYLRQHFAQDAGLRKPESQTIFLSESRVMTKDGHVLYIDPRCSGCREKFKV